MILQNVPEKMAKTIWECLFV